MAEHPFLNTETLRLSELHVQDLLYTPLEARFNRIVRVVRRALAVRVAAISFLNEEREWFKAADGWDVRELPADRSLSAKLLASGKVEVVGDTKLDLRCSTHPLVVGSPNFRFCAVYPLRDRQDHIVAALAVYDTQPRLVPEGAAELLADLGELAQRELSITDLCDAQAKLVNKLSVARRHALLDELTRLWNRRGGVELLEHAIRDAREQRSSLGICLADIDHFKAVNDRHGHAVGDQVLRKVAGLLVDCVRPEDIICRLGGEEFLLILTAVTPRQLAEIMERVRQRVASTVIQTRQGGARITLSIGGFARVPDEDDNATQLLEQADAELYRAKRAGRNLVTIVGAGA